MRGAQHLTLSRAAEGGREVKGATRGLCALTVALVALVGFAFACGPSAPPKPAMQADAPLPSEVDDPDAMAAAFGSGDDGDGGLASGDAPSGSSIAGNEDSAKTLLTQFLAPDADAVALTRSLRPTSADYKALFDSSVAPKIESAQSKDWDTGKAAIKPAAGQTEVKIVGATGADLAMGRGNAKEFPKEYKKFGKHLVATATFFRFKFTKPGEDTGTAYDGLAFVNDHWVIAPKPYRALDGKGGGLDDSGSATEDSKPKGKKKKKANP